MMVTSVTSCDDPRDKIYGIQNLLSPALRIEVDYAMAAASVFTTYAFEVLRFCKEALDPNERPGPDQTLRYFFPEALCALAFGMGWEIDQNRVSALLKEQMRHDSERDSVMVEYELYRFLQKHILCYPNSPG